MLLVDWKVLRVELLVREYDAVCRLARGEDDLADPGPARRLHGVVGAGGVDPEHFRVWNQLDPWNRREMDEHVDGLRAQGGLQLVNAGVNPDRPESLARVGQVGDQRPAAGLGSRLEVDVENLVAAIEQLLEDPGADLAASARDDAPFHPAFLDLPFLGLSCSSHRAPWTRGTGP